MAPRRARSLATRRRIEHMTGPAGAWIAFAFLIALLVFM